jgi:hypothetical protein
LTLTLVAAINPFVSPPDPLQSTPTGKSTLCTALDLYLFTRKQTVFYLDDMVAAKKGERITGRLHCVPNAKNPRDLDIRIAYAFNGENCTVSGEHEYHMC